jgi:hypothetical protein
MLDANTFNKLLALPIAGASFSHFLLCFFLLVYHSTRPLIENLSDQNSRHSVARFFRIIPKQINLGLHQEAERETIGWLTKQNEEIMLIEHDRTVQSLETSSGQGNGIVILKNCILEMRLLCPQPLQKASNCHLNFAEPIVKDEYALQPKKRKTQPNRTGADK